MPHTSDPFRALLQKKRDRDRSGFEPFAAASRRPVTPSDVEEASDRDGRADGADRHADNDHDDVGHRTSDPDMCIAVKMLLVVRPPPSC